MKLTEPNTRTGWLRISHMNINSLRFKSQIMQDFITSIKSHVVCISETWLDPNYESDDLRIDDYIFIRNDRGLRHSHTRKRRFVQGGGTAVYLHTTLNYKLLFASSIQHISETEYMILDVFPVKVQIPLVFY